MSKSFNKHSIYAKALHWALAVSVSSTLIFFVDGNWQHRYLGYFASCIGLLIFFKNLKMKQKNISDHPKLASFVHRSIILLVTALSVSGFAMGLDVFWGDEWLENLHIMTSNILIFVIILHFLGIIRDAVVNKRKTWMHMITFLNENQK